MVNAGKRLAVAVVLGPLLVASAVACQNVLGIGGDVTVEVSGDSTACGLSLARGACQACLEQSCCAQSQTCNKDPGCAGYETCLAGCGTDYTCRAQCEVDHPIGNVASIPAFDTCAITNCESPCGIGCGAVGSLAEPSTALACQQCLSDHVCSGTEVCGRNLECEETARCVETCHTFDCQNACLRENDAGTLFESSLFGGAAYCLVPCGVGANWSCVGRVSYPFAKGQITFTLTLVDSLQQAPLVNVSVKACDTGDIACKSPVAMGSTDSNGKVPLHLPAVGPNEYGFGGYFEITSPEIVPYLYFLSFPLSEPDAEIRIILLEPAALQDLVSLVSVPLDPTRGLIALLANDCYLNGAPDVTVTADGIDAKTKEFYLDGSFLSTTATATDRNGLVMFLNAPTVVVSLQVTPLATKQLSSHASVFVRQGTISLVQANPSP